MKYDLRNYQKESSAQGVHYLKNYGKPFILTLATGAGKSIIIADMCHKLNEPVLIICFTKEILEQDKAKMHSYGVDDITAYSASVGEKKIGKYTFATIGSIYKRPELFRGFKYVIIDECHGLDPKNTAGMLTGFLKAIDCTNVCGLTATPYRIVQKYFREGEQLWYTAHLKMLNRIPPFFFKKIVYKIETAELIERGYLCPIKYYSEKVDTTELEINSTGRDFTDKSVERYWAQQKRLQRIADAVAYADKHHKKSLVFCSSLRQAKNALRLVRDVGISGEMVSGATKIKDREKIIADYKKGRVKHLFNVGVFTTGFDEPALDCIILARTTMSLALYYQMVGRGVRLDPDNPKKILKVYDLCGVVERLGRVESIRIKTEEGGFRDEVWSEIGRMDEYPLFTWFVKNKPKHLQ